MALFKFLNVRHLESFPVKNFIGWNPQKFSPVNLSSFMVFLSHLKTSYIYVAMVAVLGNNSPRTLY